MSYAHDEGADFWGVLINADKSPAPLLEQLCLGIAQVMTSFDDFATSDLTPERIAAFYRKVGGNYDVLFLDTKHSALSFIYQRLGCFHSIQPSTDPYKPPSIPALQPNGFVRWQTIQLLLDPDEHCKYLQNAVELWDIENPNGGYFAKDIPRDAFPAEPDVEMIEWHEEVSRRFEVDYWKKNILRPSPPSFGTYHHHFSQKDPPPKKEEEPVSNRHRPTPHRRHHTSSNVPVNRHQRRQSTEIPPSGARKVHSTYFHHPEGFETDYASPRVPSSPPSPTSWPRQQPKTRGRERIPTFARPVSPGTVPGHETSDASSEGSGGISFHRPNHRYSYHQNLSPPQASHARRHSHEAYARKPRRELSPESQRRNTHRDIYGASPGRPYDSDDARRVRSSRVYSDEMHHRAPGPGFCEPMFDPATASSGPEIPIYTHVHPRYVSANPYMPRPMDHDPCGMDSPRRSSYRGSPNVTPNGGIPDRMRYTSAGSPRQRWAAPNPVKRGPVPIIDVEYQRGRRTPMYER